MASLAYVTLGMLMQLVIAAALRRWFWPWVLEIRTCPRCREVRK